MLERAGDGVAQVVAGARPAEFGDHHALAGEILPQQAVDVHRLIHRLLVGEVLPVRQHVGSDEVDRGREARPVLLGGFDRIVAPDVPDFAGGDRDVDLLLDPLDQLDQVFGLLLAAIDGFVADHDADDVAVVLGQIDGRADLALVAVGVLVDPGADRDLEAELVGDRRDQFDAAGRRIKADRLGHRGERLQVGADFLRVRDVVDVGMAGAFKRRVGHARQDAFEIRRVLLVAKETPKRGVDGGDTQQDGDDGAHSRLNHTGTVVSGCEPVPQFQLEGPAQAFNQ